MIYYTTILDYVILYHTIKGTKYILRTDVVYESESLQKIMRSR